MIFFVAVIASPERPSLLTRECDYSAHLNPESAFAAMLNLKSDYRNWNCLALLRVDKSNSNYSAYSDAFQRSLITSTLRDFAWIDPGVSTLRASDAFREYQAQMIARRVGTANRGESEARV